VGEFEKLEMSIKCGIFANRFIAFLRKNVMLCEFENYWQTLRESSEFLNKNI
jgi:hypothetical protein